MLLNYDEIKQEITNRKKVEKFSKFWRYTTHFSTTHGSKKSQNNLKKNS